MGIKSLGKPEAANNGANVVDSHGHGRWEYLTMSYNYSYGATTYVVNGEKAIKLKNVPLHDALTLFGQDGWDLVSISDGIYVFKRQGVRHVETENSAK